MFGLRIGALALLILACATSGCGGSGGDGAGSGDTTITPADVEYALTALNAMGAAEAPSAPPLVRDAGLDAYASTSNDVFDGDRLPHTYAGTVPITSACPAALPPAASGSTAAENEGLSGPGTSNKDAIDAILAFFLAEKSLPVGDPARGHYEAIVNPGFNSVGIAIKRSAADGFFVMTQEFCD